MQTEKERIDFAKNHSLYMNYTSQLINELVSNYGIRLKNYLTWQLFFNQVSEKTKVRVDPCYVQNDATIRLNRSIERNYKRTNNERTMVTEHNRHLVPHDNT